MLYVYTTIVNGWDNLREPAVPPDANVRYLCYTNVPNLPRVYPWEYRPIYPLSETCRTARIAKIMPHLMLPADAEWSIYHDGNFQLQMDPVEIIKDVLESRGREWAAHQHPGRNCIYAEGKILLNEKIGSPELVRRELERYRNDGHPENAGLWANGFIVRHHTPRVAALNELWWALYSTGCERDQISFPVARRRAEMDVQTLHESIFSSPYIRHRWHAAWKTYDGNPDYWAQRDDLRRRLSKLAAITGSDGGIQYPDH